MPKRYRGRLQWYKYHLRRSESDGERAGEQKFSQQCAAAEAALQDASIALQAALAAETRWSRFRWFFGNLSPYRVGVIGPLQRREAACLARLGTVQQAQRDAMREGRRRGHDAYIAAHASRQCEIEERIERRAERAQERRLRRLERSSSIRSAARAIKRVLLMEFFGAGRRVTCEYCGVELRGSGVHLEHRRPIARGGTNHRSNLGFSCEPCNLRKGTRTAEEFERESGGRGASR